MSNEGFDSGEAMSADASAQMPAELVMDQVYVLPDGARSHDSLQIGAQVRNDGGVESGPFSVRFYLDGGVIGDLPFESIAPGQKKWQELEHAALVAGTHNVAAMADYANEIRESNKQDNLGTLQFQVVEMPGVIDVQPGEGEDITVPDIAMGARSTVVNEVDRIVNGYSAGVIELWTRYAQGLSRFGQRMEFSSGEEAKFNMDAVAKGAAKGLFKSVLSLGVDAIPVPGLKQLEAAVEGGVEAYFEESERSNKAWNEHEIVDYLEKVDKEIEAGRTKMSTAILTGMAQPLLDEFDRLSANDPQHGNASRDGHIVGGKGGEFLLDLRQKLAAFNEHMPNAADFQSEIGVAFAQRASKDGKIEGKLIFHIELYRIPGGWAPQKTDSSWTLETAAPGEHARLAESLTKSLNGKHAWQLDLPKTVFLSLSSDQGDSPWAKAEIQFSTDPAVYELGAVDTSNQVAYATSELREAWDRPSTKNLALQWDEITA